MQRVSSLLPTWERTRSVDGKASGGAFGKVFGGWSDKIASPHRLSIGNNSSSSSQTQRTHAAIVTTNGKTGREEYWPSSLDKECEKAARILKSFCADGFLSYEPSLNTGSEPPSPTTASPRQVSSQIQIMKKIPPRIVQNAVGLAIFSCMRSGLWMSGSGGSGILIARKADGTWSPPSGIMLHTAGLGFAIGVDIYDCVLVINSLAALEMFTKPRLVLGTDVSLSVGPVVSVGSKVDFDNVRWKELSNTVMTYLKARGQHQAVRLDGSMVTERGNENERFYGASVEVVDILADNVRKSIPEIAPLFEAIKAAEGRSDADPRVMQALSLQPAPGDANIETTPAASPATPISAKFGVPNTDDPDPFGVIALEMAGLEIREAGSRLRPTSTQFDYAPSPTAATFNHSSIHNGNPHSNFHRQSVDTYASRSNSNRGSVMSSRTQATTMTDAFTQTDVGESARASPSPTHAKSRRESETRPVVTEPEEIDYTKVDMSSLEQHLNRRESVDIGPASAPAEIPASASAPVEVELRLPTSISEVELPKRQDTAATQATVKPAAEDTAIPLSPGPDSDEDADDEDEDDEDEEEPVIFEMATAAQPVRTALMRPQQATQVIQVKGALVTIHKRPPPALPPRNPARSSRASRSDFGGDVSSLKSPVRSSFESCASSFPKAAHAEEPTTPSAGATDATQMTSDEAASQSGSGPVIVGTSTDANKSYHHRNSSSVYTTILPADSLSPPAVPIPTTPRATTGSTTTTTDESKSSSVTAPDDDSTSTSTTEPTTPKAFEDLLPHRHQNKDENVIVGKMSPGHLSSATIQVA